MISSKCLIFFFNLLIKSANRVLHSLLLRWTLLVNYWRIPVKITCYQGQLPFFNILFWSDLGPVFMFCASGFVFGGAECVGSRFHVLRSRTSFRRCRGRQIPFSCFARRTRFRPYRGRRVPFSYFALTDSFSAVPSASGPVFMFCAPRLVIGGVEGVGSRFHVLRVRIRFRRYRGRRILFSCFVLLDSFSVVPRMSDPIFMFCAHG
jgi:hypothetical protein